MNELDKLRKMLRDADIPFEDYQEREHLYSEALLDSIMRLGPEANRYSRNQIIYGRNSEDGMYWKFDAIYQYGSLGDGFIETYGELGVDSDGEPRVMTAEEAFKIIKSDWERSGSND